MKKQAKRLLKTLTLCACISGYAGVSHALPMVQTAACLNLATATCATGVTAVDVSGTLYDVVFSQAAYDVVFANTPPTFSNDDAGGIAAVAALIPILNASGIRGLLGAPTDADFDSFLFVPTLMVIAPLQFNRAAVYFSGADFAPHPAGGWVNFTTDDQSIYTPGRYNAYAVFSPSRVEVPAPPRLLLIGLGLFAIRLIRR